MSDQDYSVGVLIKVILTEPKIIKSTLLTCQCPPSFMTCYSVEMFQESGEALTAPAGYFILFKLNDNLLKIYLRLSPSPLRLRLCV